MSDMILTRARFQELEQRLAKAEADKAEFLAALNKVQLICTNHGAWAENMTSFELMNWLHDVVTPAVTKAEGLS
jgi:hypothetical protein